MIYQNIEELIGKTPLLKLNNNIYAKLEKFNLTGSSKDRAALMVLNDGIKNNKINSLTTIIEATSGNMGISLACLCSKHKVNCIIVMPNNMSKERMQLLKAYNAKIVLTSNLNGMKEATKVAKLLQERIPNSYLFSQFENPLCIEANYLTTGKEIYDDLPSVECVVIGIGTASTISGVGRYLKEKNKNIQIVGVEPSSSPLITLGYYHHHKIQGIGSNFIPKNYKSDFVDEVISVTDEEAYKGTKLLREMGLLEGISSGAVYMAAKLFEKKYKSIVVIFPDGGEKYLSVEGFIDD